MTEKYNIKDNPHKGNQGITRAFRAAINSWNGFVYAYQEESAFRQELALNLILIPIAIYLPYGAVEKVLLICSTLLVLIVELLNSSVEAAVDRISYEEHDLSKRAKDFGSAAVTVAILIATITWGLISYQTFFSK
jgi:diacylglycerol kinase (ATP)